MAGWPASAAPRRFGAKAASWPVRILCEETHRPYDRPPLSKELLTGNPSPRGFSFRDAEWYERSQVELLPGVAATRLVPAEQRVELSDGGQLRYEKLLVATGGRPRTLELLSGYDNVSLLRTVDDATALRERLLAGEPLVLVGAGFIGLEIAASARSLGCEVTVVEALPVPLGRVVGADLGRWFMRLHERHGVRMLTGRTVRSVDGELNRIRRLRLDDGTVLECGHLVIGVGSEPACDWLAGSGLSTAGGVAVDAAGRTASPEVFAAGDAAATYDPYLGRHVPGSHWEQAARQGAQAARAMLGREPAARRPTSFWTDQYGVRIQYLGRYASGDRLQIDGDPAEPRFTATFLRDEAARRRAACQPSWIPPRGSPHDRTRSAVMTYLAEIDESACAAHGDCVDIAPEAFALDDVAQVIGTAPGDRLIEAAELCPSTAIRVVDRDTGEQVYP